MFRNSGFLSHLKRQHRFRYQFKAQAAAAYIPQRTNQTTTDHRSDNDIDHDHCTIYHPPDYELDGNELQKSIRTCMTGNRQDDHAAYTRDTGMSLCFLGTGAGTPTKQRSTTSTLMRLGGSSMLFDAGEGVQRQLLFTRANPSHIERIFITHLHGDHIFGLPGFLLGLQVHVMAKQQNLNVLKNKRKREELENHVIKIYGPRTLVIIIVDFVFVCVPPSFASC